MRTSAAIRSDPVQQLGALGLQAGGGCLVWESSGAYSNLAATMKPARILLAIFFLGTAAAEKDGPAPKPQYEWEQILIPPASAQEPIRDQFSPSRAVAYMEDGALAWTRKRECIACHTNGTYFVTRPALTRTLGQPPSELRKFIIEELDELRSMEPQKLRSGVRPTQVAYAAQGLAEWDAHVTGELSPETREALNLMLDLQDPEGGWNNVDTWPPFESSKYQSATVAATAMAAAPGWMAANGDREAVRKTREYMRTRAPHDYGRLLLLWVSTRWPGLLEDEKKQELVEMVWRHQRADGGWSIRTFATPETWGRGNRAEKLRAEDDFDNPPSDGHQTGLCVLVLRRAGVPADDPRIQRAVDWLLSNQRESGRWWTRSLNTDKFHFITYSGTCYPLLALESCGRLALETTGP